MMPVTACRRLRHPPSPGAPHLRASVVVVVVTHHTGSQPSERHQEPVRRCVRGIEAQSLKQRGWLGKVGWPVTRAREGCCHRVPSRHVPVVPEARRARQVPSHEALDPVASGEGQVVRQFIDGDPVVSPVRVGAVRLHAPRVRGPLRVEEKVALPAASRAPEPQLWIDVVRQHGANASAGSPRSGTAPSLVTSWGARSFSNPRWQAGRVTRPSTTFRELQPWSSTARQYVYRSRIAPCRTPSTRPSASLRLTSQPTTGCLNRCSSRSAAACG